MPLNPSTDLVLVYGASGKQGGPLLRVLVPQFKRLRLVVHSDGSQQRMSQQYPHADVVQADINDPHAVRELFRGVSTVYYSGPSFHHHETQCGYHAIDAAVKEAKEGNFKHFVFSSVLNTQFRKLLNHDCKRYVEEYLYESGLQWTVLKPCNFLDMFPVAKLASEEKPVYPAPWDPTIKNSLIALDDLADVGIKVLLERETHYYAEYPLCSTLPVPYTDMVDAAARALKKEVAIQKAPIEDRVTKLVSLVLGDEPNPRSIDGAERLVLWYERHGLCGSPNVLEMLLGRKATTLDEWMEKKFREAREK